MCVMQHVYLIFKDKFKRCRSRCQGSIRTIWSNKGLSLIQIKCMDRIEHLSLYWNCLLSKWCTRSLKYFNRNQTQWSKWFMLCTFVWCNELLWKNNIKMDWLYLSSKNILIARLNLWCCDICSSYIQFLCSCWLKLKTEPVIF